MSAQSERTKRLKSFRKLVFCSPVCEALWVNVTPGQWIDPAELMLGGRYYDRPEIWAEP